MSWVSVVNLAYQIESTTTPHRLQPAHQIPKEHLPIRLKLQRVGGGGVFDEGFGLRGDAGVVTVGGRGVDYAVAAGEHQ